MTIEARFRANIALEPHIHARAGTVVRSCLLPLRRLAVLCALAIAGTPLHAAPPSVAVAPVSAGRAMALGVTMTAISDTLLVLDSNSPGVDGPAYAYYAVRVTNSSGAALNDIRATLSLSNGAFALGGSTPQRPEVYIGTLAAGASRTAYWFVAYPRVHAQTTNATVSVTDASAQTATYVRRLVTYSSISANAGGKIVSVDLAGNALGGISSFDVLYSYGGTSSGDQFQWNPAGNASFSAGCFQLLGLRVMSSTVTAIPSGTVDALTIRATTNQGGTDKRITVRYFFRVLCANVSTLAEPYASQTSGNTNYKYTGNYGTSATLGNVGFPPALNTFPTSKANSTSSLPTGGPSQFTISIVNNASTSIVLDSIVDALPAGMVFDSVATGSSVTASNSSSLPVALSTGSMVFRSFSDTLTGYRIAPADTLKLRYWVTVTATPGSYTNTARPYIAGTVVGAGPVSSTIGVGSAALSVTKTAITPLSPSTADTVRFQIVTSNAGPATAAAIALVDSLPAGATFIDATNAGTVSSGVVSWPSYSLANGAARTDTVRLTLAAAGSITNRARATSSTADGDNSDNTSGATISVTAAQSDLSITAMRTGADTVVTGDVVRFIVTTSNGGPQAATATRVAAALPAGATVFASSGAPTITSDSVIWNVGALTNGASRTDTLQLTLATIGAARVDVRATTTTADSVAANDTASASVAVRALRADLAITHVRITADTVTVGDTVRYVITTTNLGPDQAQSTVVRDTLGVGLTYASASGSPTVSGQELSWNVGALASGGTRTDTVTVTAATAGTLSSIAQATSTNVDLAPSNNRATADVTVLAPIAVADLSVTHTVVGSTSVLRGATVQYIITTTNIGPDAASTVVTRDSLPSDVTYASATGSPSVSGRELTWSIGALASGASRVDTVTVTASTAGTAIAVALTGSATCDPASGNDRATATLTISEPPPIVADLSVTLTRLGAASVTRGDSVRFVITTLNNGPDAASGVVVRDTLSAELTYVSSSGGGTVSAQEITWAIGSLASGATRTDTVTVVASDTGAASVIAHVAAASGDPGAANDRATAGVTILEPVPVADLSITHTIVGATSVTRGAIVQYVVTTTNAGPDAAASVVTRDSLPVELTYSSATGAPSVSGRELTWTIGSLASGASRTDTITVTASTSGSAVAVAVSGSATGDPSSANNRATATLTISEPPPAVH
jgi:uncharacterized repeat protein (TIGR01451 family)